MTFTILFSLKTVAPSASLITVRAFVLRRLFFLWHESNMSLYLPVLTIIRDDFIASNRLSQPSMHPLIQRRSFESAQYHSKVLIAHSQGLISSGQLRV